jgi:hypothetical protein
MRISCWCCFVLGLCFLSLPALGQSDLPRFAGGVYGSIGGEPLPIDLTVSGGAYLEAARFRFRPGVEVRGTAQTIGAAGQGQMLMLAGPRVSHPLFGGDVYAAGLFGPSHMMNATGTKEISGVTSQVAFGVEKDLGPYVRWRVIELNAGFFSGASGLQTFAISTGLVLHFH